MTVPKTYKSIIERFKQAPEEIQEYFTPSIDLIEKYPWQVSLAYMFSCLETAQNMALYCGVVKIHKAHSEVAWKAINSLHITRQGYRDIYKTVFGKSLKKEIIEKIVEAEKIRDNVMHGKDVTQEEMRTAVLRIIEYSELYNDYTYKLAGFKPFGNLKGFKGRAEPLNKSTTMWILKGMKILP